MLLIHHASVANPANPRSPDSYHTCYVLTGLSATQHHHYRTTTSIVSSGIFASAFSWQSSPVRGEDNVYDKADRLVAFHPLYVIPHQAAANMRLWCEACPVTT
jgi:protein farnesyltransferase subunit beta